MVFKYEEIKQSILSQEAVHYDETSWKVQKGASGNYGWVMTGIDNNNVIFLLGKSRGKGNLEDLGVAKIGISDDYGAYRKTFEEHQLCWAHPQRKLRDLMKSDEIQENKKIYCINSFNLFSKLYKNIRDYKGKIIPDNTKERFISNFQKICKINLLDPNHLKKIKESLLKNQKKYFTFLNHPNIPIDNNKAERSLRHLVIKRKISFGSKTEKGARITSILASVILSLKWNNKDDWFQKYLNLEY